MIHLKVTKKLKKERKQYDILIRYMQPSFH